MKFPNKKHSNPSFAILCILFLFHLSTAQSTFTPPKLKRPPLKKTSTQPPQVIDSGAATATTSIPVNNLASPNTPPSNPVPDTANSLLPSSAVGIKPTVDLPVPDTILIPQIDFSNQPIQDVLRLLSAPYGLNISVDPELKATVTLHLTNIKLKDAILFIIRENDATFSIVNGIIKVYKQLPLPPPPPPPVPVINQVFDVQNSKMKVDLKEAPLDSVVRWIAVKTGRSIIPEKNTKGNLTAFFNDQPVDNGIKLIFETNGFEIVTKDGLTYIFPAGGGFEGQDKDKSGRLKHFVAVRDKSVSFNVNNAPIGDIIKEVARQANLAIYLYDEIKGTVTAKVADMAMDELFESLLRNTGSTFWISKGVYYFGNRDMYEKKITEMITCNYLPAEDIIPLLPQSISSKAVIKKVKEYNALLVESSTSDIIELTRAFVAMVDKPIAQILIEAWVVEVKLDKLRNFGLKLFGKDDAYKAPPRSYFPAYSAQFDKDAIFNFIDNFIKVTSNVKRVVPYDFVAQLDLLENEGISNVISKPQIATLNGHTANINFGTTQYYLLQKEVVEGNQTSNWKGFDQRYEKISIEMNLSVTPWVSSKNEVTMDINPKFEVPGAQPGGAANIPPPINTRSLKSTVRVKDGEMIILGGLIEETKSETLEKVPFLGDIPILKYLFSTNKSQKTKTQLMIYLIPHIYYGSERSIDPSSVNLNTFDPPRLLYGPKEAQPERKGHYWRRADPPKKVDKRPVLVK